MYVTIRLSKICYGDTMQDLATYVATLSALQRRDVRSVVQMSDSQFVDSRPRVVRRNRRRGNWPARSVAIDRAVRAEAIHSTNGTSARMGRSRVERGRGAAGN